MKDTGSASETKPPAQQDLRTLENYSKFFRRLALSLPHVHRPTRDDFLNAASGFWQRMRVRLKWLTIRSFRKYNADEISAFITWLLLSQTLWLLVGTYVPCIVFCATKAHLKIQDHLRFCGAYYRQQSPPSRYVRASSSYMTMLNTPAEYVARAISDYLTTESGIQIVFESAIVPKWKDSRISFKNVYITRRPDAINKARADKDVGHSHARGYDVSNHPANHVYTDDDDDSLLEELPQEDTNYSMFDLSVDSIDVTLSLTRWLEGKGLITDAVVKGVRGVLGTCFAPFHSTCQ